MYKTNEERLKVYKEMYKRVGKMMMDAGYRLLTPIQRDVAEIEHCLHEIIGAEAVLGISPEKRIAVMDEILGPDLKKEVIPALKYCMLSL